jgi:MarR family transcriptional regulator, organic hydroperoxide resistance regulator
MYRLTETFPYLLNRVGVRMGDLFTRRLVTAGLTLSMYRVLAALWEKGEHRLGDLAEVTNVELSTLSRMVGKLAQRGLVSRGRPDSNGRTVRIELTAKGKQLAERFIPLATQHEDVSLHGFNAADIARLKADLVAVYRNLNVVEEELHREVSTGRKRVKRRRRPRGPLRSAAR